MKTILYWQFNKSFGVFNSLFGKFLNDQQIKKGVCEYDTDK